MVAIINECVNVLNHLGGAFSRYAVGAFLQSALLVILLFGIDRLLHRRVRAVFRYWVWLLVLVKLVLPPTFSLPTGIGYWLGDRLPGRVAAWEPAADTGGFEIAERHRPGRSEPAATVPSLPPAAHAIEPQAPIVPAAARLTPITWQAVALLFWMAGVLAFIALLAQRIRFVRGLVAASTPAGGELLGVLDQCRRRMGVGGPVGLRTSDAVSSPAVCGLLRPMVLMPASLVKKLSPEGLRAALIHELAHIKRGDLWINSVQTLLQVVHFYNPFVWFANAMIRRTCEEAVDETVLVTLGGEARSYSNTLIDIGEMAFWKADLGLRMVGVAESRKALQWRIKHMLTRPIPTSARIGALGTTTIILVAALLLPMARAERSNEDVPVTPLASTAAVGESAPSAGANDILIDPNTGLKLVLTQTITGANDIIETDSGLIMSPNGKFLLWRGRVVPLDGSSAFTLRELEGTTVASWSPDGRKIAFDADGIGLLPVSPDTARPTGPARRLLDDDRDWSQMRIYWSADSERILFTKYNSASEHEVGSIALRDGRLDKQPDYADFGLVSPDGKMVAYSIPPDGIWIKPTGGGASRIARVPAEWFDDVEGWTPDSQWVVDAGGRIHFSRAADGHAIDLHPPEPIGAFVGRSPDGRKLYFYLSSFEEQEASKVVSLSNGSVLDVITVMDDIVYHSWLSDSSSLAMYGLNFKEEGQQVWSIPLGGGEGVKFDLSSLPGYVESLSPDGGKLLSFTLPAGGRTLKDAHLHVTPFSLQDGQPAGPARLVFTRWYCLRHWPQIGRWGAGNWSADGTKIAVPNRADRGCELWVLFADGGEPVRIIETPCEIGPCPQWSPDGSTIAFTLVVSDRQMLQVIPAAGGTARTVLTTAKDQSIPFGWSLDGREILAACDGTITAFPATGGTGRAIVRLQDAGCDEVSWLRWSPDGLRLAFYGGKRGEASRVHLFSPSTGRIDKLENSPDMARDLVWSPDSRMICCIVKEFKRVRPAGVLRELDLAEAVRKAPPIAENRPLETQAVPQSLPIDGPVFSDNFDNGLSPHWQIVTTHSQPSPPPGQAVENGQLMLSNSSARLYQIDWTDYIVTVRVCLKETVASGDGVFGINARTTPSNFGIKNMDRYSLLVLCINGIPKELYLGFNYRDASNTAHNAHLDRSPFAIVPDRWYTLEFEVRGQNLRGYLDGKLMVESTDERLSKGGVWLNAWKTRVLFDDFTVRRLR